MEVIGITINILSPIFLVIGTAALFAYITKPDDRALASLTLYVTAPALIFRSIMQTELTLTDILALGGFVVVLMGILWLLSWLIARVLRLSPAMTAAFIISVLMVNAGNYGLSLNEFAFGQDGLAVASIYLVITIVLGNNIAIFVASQGKTNARAAIGALLRNPIFWASIIGVVFKGTGIPIPPDSALDRWIATLAQATVPLMLTLLGFRLVKVRLNAQMLPVLAAVGVRLGLSTLIAFPLAWLFGLEGLLFNVALVQASTPTAVMGAAIAIEYDVAPEFVSAVVFVSTLASIFTMTILLAVLM